MKPIGCALPRGEFLKLAGAVAAATAMPFSRAHANPAGMLSRAIPDSKDGERLPVIGLGTYRAFRTRGDVAAMDKKHRLPAPSSRAGEKSSTPRNPMMSPRCFAARYWKG